MMALAEPARTTDAVSIVHQLLQRAATLPAATGAAIFSAIEGVHAMQAIGVCSSWMKEAAPTGVSDLLRAVVASDRPVVRTAAGNGVASGDGATAYRAALPIPRETGDRQILVVVGEARHPFSALDDEVLVALGRQLGSALDGAELNARLKARTVELSHLSVRMIQQHEEERRRLSLELHDETAQVFSAVKLKLGVIGEQADAETARSIATVAQLVDQGMQSIRSVTEMLRPAALDDLGLDAALRSLALEFEESTGIEVRLTTTGDIDSIAADAELALFRAMQEGLSNVARHANARLVTASLTARDGAVLLVLADDGAPTPADVDIDRMQQHGHMGLAGIRERAEALGGRLAVETGPHGGLQISLEIPSRPAESA
jgi:signal transduction histidine kinase